MSTLDLHEPRQQARNGGFEAVVARGAASYADLVELTIDAFDPGLRYGPCPWLGPPGFLPQRGDRALVVMDDSQGPWAFVQATAPGPAQGNADTLDGHDSTYFATAADLTSGLAGKLGLHAKADDADKLDAKDSTAFVEHAIIDAKGDLIVGSAADAAIRKAVGANDELLVADSTQTGGVKWSKVGNSMLAEAIKGRNLAWNVATSPPSSPSNGDLWIYPGAGFYWLFVYDSSETTNKWKFVGGSPLSAEVDTSETTATTGAYVDLATAGPSITIPRGGDYEFAYGSDFNDAANAVISARATPKWGAAAAADVDSIAYSHQAQGATIENHSSPARSRTKTGLATNDVVKLQYKTNLANQPNIQRRFLKCWPVRIS